MPRMRTAAWKRESTSARSCSATTLRSSELSGVEFVKRIFIIAGGIVLVVAILLALTLRGSTEKDRYRFVQVERGDLEHKVSSTGKLEATTTVQVGTQISGRVVAL